MQDKEILIKAKKNAGEKKMAEVKEKKRAKAEATKKKKRAETKALKKKRKLNSKS